jgi:NAD(P)-dependent dehydrogenase (short-subunit alcohol dehydrogenase family)
MTLDVNLGSTFRVCRALLRTMLQQPPDAGGRRGAILTMGSVTALSPEPHHFATHAYAASKSGIMGLSEATASYYAPHGIRINALAPGLVRTPMSRRAQNDAEIMAFMKDKQPLADLIEPDDIARAAVFLLSDEARTITGVVFPVDAGWRVS